MHILISERLGYLFDCHLRSTSWRCLQFCYQCCTFILRLLFLPPVLKFIQVSYSLSIINAAISFRIVYLAYRPYPDWPRVGIPAQVAARFFGAVNVFLFVVPLTNPPIGADPYTSLPYWTHAVAGWAVFGLGFLYWVFWAQISPRVGKYKLYRVEERDI